MRQQPIPKRGNTKGPPQANPVSRALVACVARVVLVASLVAFWPALSGDFSGFDDVYLLVGEDHYRGLGPDNLYWMFGATRMGHYQPLTWVSYAIDFELWEMTPRGFHLTNMVIHSINALLVFGLA